MSCCLYNVKNNKNAYAYTYEAKRLNPVGRRVKNLTQARSVIFCVRLRNFGPWSRCQVSLLNCGVKTLIQIQWHAETCWLLLLWVTYLGSQDIFFYSVIKLNVFKWAKAACIGSDLNIRPKGFFQSAVSGLTRSPTITRLCHIYSPGNCHSITRPARCVQEQEVRWPVDTAVSFIPGVQPSSHQSSNTPRWVK